MHGIISKARSTDMPMDIQFNLFDSLVLPIMKYGSEIWGLCIARKATLKILHDHPLR